MPACIFLLLARGGVGVGGGRRGDKTTSLVDAMFQLRWFWVLKTEGSGLGFRVWYRRLSINLGRLHSDVMDF